MDTMISFWNNVGEVFRALSDFFALKVVGAWGLTVVLYLVGASHVQLLGALTTLVAIDLATGVYSAYKTGDVIESRKMVKTAIKWTLYMLMISAAHLTESLVQFDSYLAQATIAFLGATELVSILENIGKSGVAIPQKLLNKLEQFRGDQ